MAKFKVIEKSRFLDNSKINGGTIILCSEKDPYRSVSCPPHETCGVGVQNFFVCGDSSYGKTCGTDVNYVYTSFCLSMGTLNVLCGRGDSY